MSGRQRLSLKGQALKYLAMREHSRQELRRKLLPHAKAACQAAASGSHVVMGASAAAAAAAAGAAFADPGSADMQAVDASENVGPCLDKLLDWLEAHDLLSQQRFVESRVRTRSARFGASRIKHELSQHGVALTPEQRTELDRSELERAREVWQRKFGDAPQDPAARAKQMRFLAARGFASDAIRRVVPSASRGSGTDLDDEVT